MDPTNPTPAPVQPTVPETPIVPSTPKTNWLLSIIFLILGILIGAAGFWVYQKYLASPKAQPTASSPTPLATPDVTANWKIYSNGEFSFKYPETWNVEGLKIFNPDQSIEMWAIKSDGALYNECMKLDNTQIIWDLKIKTFSGVTTAEMCDPVNLTLREKWIVKVEGEGFQPGLQYSYRTGSSDAEGIFTQILSTFKFLGQTTMNTSNWNMYTNPQFNFSFRYPTIWKDVTDPNVIKNGNREFRFQTNLNEFVSGVVFNGRTDTSNDLTWSKNIQLGDNIYLLITYTDNLGPGSKGGTSDMATFNQMLSTIKVIK